jgi:hypothetical protein
MVDPVVAGKLQLMAAKGGATGKRTKVTESKAILSSTTKSIDGGKEILSDYYRNGWYEKSADNKTTKQKYPAKTLAPVDDKIASIRVYQGHGKTGNDLIPSYTKFMLESSQETHQERHQIIETFGDFYVFFFGESPPMYSYTGHLINAKNVNWVAEWQHYYENYLRGTKCADSNARIILTYGNIQVEGFILSFSTQHNAVTEQGVPIQFNIVQTKRSSLHMPDDFNLKESTAAQIETTKNVISNIAGKEGAGTSAPETSQAYNKTKDAVSGKSASTMEPSGYTEPKPGEVVQNLG